jgi:ATP/maltotriose-dependent transcriptional regulator MalT
MGQGILGAISPDDLAFTEEEAQELAANIGVQLNLKQFDRIYANIGGWPVLHHLLYISFQQKKGKQISETLGLLTRPNELLYEYLASELLQQEPPEIREFLCRTSLMDELQPALCDELLGTRDSKDILERLRDGLFLTQVEDGPEATYVHSHEILRDFLQHVLNEQYGAAEVRLLYGRLAHSAVRQQDWDAAITSFCYAQAFAEAARIVREEGLYLLSAIQFHRLENWLRPFPDTWLETEPTLLTYRGILLREQKNARAEDCLVAAIRVFTVNNDMAGVAWANSELGWLHYQALAYKQAVAVLRNGLSAPAVPARLKARLLHYLSMATLGLDRPREALEFGLQARAILEQLETAEDRMALTRLLRHLSGIYAFSARYREALQALQEAYQLAQALQLSDWSSAWIDNQLAHIYKYLGQFDQAHACLDEADRLLEKYRLLGSQSRLLNYVLITRGHLYREIYDYERAEEIYLKAGRGHPNGVLLALRLAQRDRMREALDLALTRWRDVQKRESPVEKALYQAMLGTAYLGVGDYEEARAYLEDADRILAEHQATYGLIPVRAYLSKLAFVTGKPATGIELLRYVFDRMAEAGCYNLDWWQPWVFAELCAKAIAADIHPDFVEGLAKRRFTVEHASPYLSLVNSSKQTLRRRAIRILEHLGATTRLEARLMLNGCESAHTRERLIRWLDSGWLTEVGLLRLRQFLSWRQTEVLLAWICPRLHGSIEEMGKQLAVSRDTINTHIETIGITFEQAIGEPFPKGKGAHALAYDWAIHNGIVNPYASESC